MAQREARFEAQVRDLEDHTSDAMGGDVDVEVVDDTLHSRSSNQSFDDFSTIRVYLVNNHNEAFDVEIQHTRPEDDGYANPSAHSTHSLAAGGGVASVALDGPVGNIRFATTTAASAAPTSGEFEFVVLGVR